MEKAGSGLLPKARVSRAKSGCAKPRKKASQPKLNLAADRAEVAKMIDQIRKEVGSHSGRTAELKANLEKVTSITLNMLEQVQELRNILESSREGDRKEKDPIEAPSVTLEERSQEAAEQRDESSAAPAAFNGMKKILVVDDDPTTINIISHFLQKENYLVRTSNSGVDGLKKAFQETPDLILLDVMMPDLNGFQFLSIYRKDEENARTPVVILSSLSEEADVLKGLEIGAVDYITKPFSPQVLIAKIKKNLNSGP